MLSKIALGLAIAAAATGVLAQSSPDIQARQGNSAYMQDSRGVIVRTPFGLCMRTGYWTPADAVPGCDGPLEPPVARATAPAIAAAPAPVAVPAPVAAAPKRCDTAVTLINDQTFTFNKSVLTSAAKKRIDDEVMSKIAACGKVEIILATGHTDRLGTPVYNQKLSEKRANAVATYLKAKGVTAPIDTLGAGKTQAVKACDDKLPRKQLIECLAPNRRVVIEVRGTAQ